VLIAVGFFGCLALYSALPEDRPSRGVIGPTPTPSRPVATGTPDATPTEPPAPESSPTPSGSPVPPGAVVDAAPIDEAEIVTTGSPPRYSVHIVAGLSSGCSQPGSQDVSRRGDVIQIDVRNYVMEGLCTQIYGTYELTVPLDDLQRGTEYTVYVNDQTLNFTAE
jgi:hypothetical protein